MKQVVFKTHIPDPIKRSCHDCHDCQASISWWCKNEEAVKAHSSNIPGRIKCDFWTPCKTLSKFKEEYCNKINQKPWYIKIFISKTKLVYDDSKYIII